MYRSGGHRRRLSKVLYAVRAGGRPSSDPDNAGHQKAVTLEVLLSRSDRKIEPLRLLFITTKLNARKSQNHLSDRAGQRSLGTLVRSTMQRTFANPAPKHAVRHVYVSGCARSCHLASPCNRIRCNQNPVCVSHVKLEVNLVG